MKKILAIFLVISFVACLSGMAFAAEDKAPAAKPVKAAPAVAAPGAGPGAMARPLARPNFAVTFGSVTNVNTADPAKPILEVKSDVDDKAHTIELTPWTNVTKVTDISEIKPGDTVRVMTKKVNDKEVAMTVVFGKIRNIPMPRPLGQGTIPARPPAARPVQTPKK